AGTHHRALRHGTQHRVRARSRWHPAPAGARGQAAGTVRPGGDPAHRPRPGPLAAAPVVAGRAPAAGHRRPAQFLGEHLARSAPGLRGTLQDLFGVAATPRIAHGRVPLLLHLLSPAGRPLQVPAALRSFWEHTWPEVRREMKGRYPRHPWPEDPWSATATHR